MEKYAAIDTGEVAWEFDDATIDAKADGIFGIMENATHQLTSIDTSLASDTAEPVDRLKTSLIKSGC